LPHDLRGSARDELGLASVGDVYSSCGIQTAACSLSCYSAIISASLLPWFRQGLHKILERPALVADPENVREPFQGTSRWCGRVSGKSVLDRQVPAKPLIAGMLGDQRQRKVSEVSKGYNKSGLAVRFDDAAVALMDGSMVRVARRRTRFRPGAGVFATALPSHFPSRSCFAHEGDSMSWLAQDEALEQLAHELRQRGLRYLDRLIVSVVVPAGNAFAAEPPPDLVRGMAAQGATAINGSELQQHVAERQGGCRGDDVLQRHLERRQHHENRQQPGEEEEVLRPHGRSP